MNNAFFLGLCGLAFILGLSNDTYAQANKLDELAFGSTKTFDGASQDQINLPDSTFGSAAIPSTINPMIIKDRLSAVDSGTSFQTRGARDAKLYAELAPLVVMVVTNDGIGSGVIIDRSGLIITNWHVIEGYDVVGVIYKPREEGRKIQRSDLRRAQVVRFDEVSDLALVQVEDPVDVGKQISLGQVSDVPIGSDVHAIGHPTGETWTYTKGIVSQYRKGYEWVTESGKAHQADVIQTQTPINPGNSGGPLLSDNQQLVGINSFVAEGEGLNFAVSVDEVRRFIGSAGNRYASNYDSGSSTSPASDSCASEKIGSERSEDNLSTLVYWDYDCDGESDAVVKWPDNTSKPVYVSLDSTDNGLIDTIYVDFDRDGKIDFSYYDTDGSGSADLIGYHADGNLEPYKFESLEG